MSDSWTVLRLLTWTTDYLKSHGSESARLDAEVLLAHVVGCKRIDLYGMRYAEVATPEVRQSFRDLIRRRLEGEVWFKQLRSGEHAGLRLLDLADEIDAKRFRKLGSATRRTGHK